MQNLLATVVGWELSFGAIPGLLTAIYYRYLAEKRGRRLVLFLSVLGHVGMLAWIVMIRQLPFLKVCCRLLNHIGAYDNIFEVQLAWVSAVFFFIGGGTRVFNSLIFATVSDSLAHSRRYVLHACPTMYLTDVRQQHEISLLSSCWATHQPPHNSTHFDSTDGGEVICSIHRLIRPLRRVSCRCLLYRRASWQGRISSTV